MEDPCVYAVFGAPIVYSPRLPPSRNSLNVQSKAQIRFGEVAIGPYLGEAGAGLGVVLGSMRCRSLTAVFKKLQRGNACGDFA